MINKDKIKGFLSGVCITVILSSGAVFADSISKTVTAVYNNIKIMVDGEEITPKDVNGNTVEPFIIDGTTYLPVRAVAAALGKDVNWDGETNTVYIGKMPEKKECFSVDTSSLMPFSKAELIFVNSTPITGGIFNYYITQNAIDEYMRYASDNYSPNGNLQTLTINSVPAAKFHAEQAVENIKLIYSVCDDAEKNGFLKRKGVDQSIDEQWKSFCSKIGDDSSLFAFADANSISLSDLETLAKKSFLATLYIDDVYENKLQEKYDTTAFEANLRKNYITVKHILVEDENLAKDIISKLDKGVDFDSLMKEHNIDPGATESGYTFTYGQMVEPFEKAAYALNENTFTKEAVKSNYGYHIIYRLPLSEDAVAEEISTHKQMLASEATNSYFTALSEKASLTYTSEYEKYIKTIK